ncbi:MAG: FecR domain-containing protein [Sulfurospirillaceae bacterium]|nr:FecR domain-containing protein [Sulfurospirillaceae bacterium]
MRDYFIKFIGLISIPALLGAASSIGYVKTLQGNVTITHKDKTIVPLKQGDKVFEKDLIKTADRSTVGITFEDNTRISIGSNAEFFVDAYLFEPANKNVAFKSNLFKGSMGCVTGLISKIKPDAMEIKAKTATIGIRGTSFVVEVKE